jgi:DNA polymerase-4
MARVVFLVDMNSFFISCEITKNNELAGKPAAVAGDPKNRSGIILSANYEARKYGVKTTMLLHDAKKLCPEIVFVPPDNHLYSTMSEDVMEILHSFTPVMQQNSIDEAWLDLTGCGSIFGTPMEIAEKIMKKIQEELGLPCSIGIAENKFLAKMASEMKKPMGITELWNKDIKTKMWPLPVRAMYGVGKQTEKKLLNIGISTIGGIAASDINILSAAFGRYGAELWKLANGIDESLVETNPRHDSRSISRSTTLREDTNDIEFLKTVMLSLCEEVGYDARRSNFKGNTVSITLKYNDFKVITRQKTVKQTNLTKDIYEAGVKLLEDNYNKNRLIRLIGIGINGASGENSEQISIFSMGNITGTNREEKLEKAVDALKGKYGSDIIKRARLIK